MSEETEQTDDGQQEFRCLEPFDIDNGELAGIDAQSCFVLGAEWWQVKTLLDAGELIEKPIHDANANRVKRMCIRRGRRFKMSDNGPEWKWLEVEAG